MCAYGTLTTMPAGAGEVAHRRADSCAWPPGRRRATGTRRGLPAGAPRRAGCLPYAPALSSTRPVSATALPPGSCTRCRRVRGGGARSGLAGTFRASLERALMFGQALAAINCRYAGARGLMYANTAGTVVSVAEAAASSGKVDPRRLGIARNTGGRVQGGRCGSYACGADTAPPSI